MQNNSPLRMLSPLLSGCLREKNLIVSLIKPLSSKSQVLNWVIARQDSELAQAAARALLPLGLAATRTLQPGTAWQVALPDGQDWQVLISVALASLPIDWMLIPQGWRPRLAVFDMDSTLITMEVIDELAALAKVKPEVAALTAAAMRGEMDFKSSFEARMRYLAGLTQASMLQVVDDMQLMPGTPQLLSWLQSLGCRTAIVSGGFDYFAHIVQQRLGIDEVIANRLEIKDGCLTGQVLGAVVDAEHKLQSLKRLAQIYGIDLGDTLVLGDGANDLPMLKAAGVGLAFHAKPQVQQQAPWSARSISMDQVRYLLTAE